MEGCDSNIGLSLFFFVRRILLLMVEKQLTSGQWNFLCRLDLVKVNDGKGECTTAECGGL